MCCSPGSKWASASSGALIAAGWHSLSDLFSDALCWASVQLGAHGYERLEHVCTLGIAAILQVS